MTPTGASGRGHPWDADPLLDTSFLEEMQGLTNESGHELVGEIVCLFERSTPEAIRELGGAWERGGAAEVGALAHRLKGSAATLGCLRLAHLCEELEGAMGRGELDEAAEAVRDLPGTFRDTLTEMRGRVPSR